MKITPHKKNKSAQNDPGEMREAFRNIGHEPHIDWALILIIFIVICGALVANGYLSFVRVGSILSQSTTNEGPQHAAIDAASLTQILDQFQARDRERQDLIKTYKGPTDPAQ